MPIYGYHCDSCDKEFEALVSARETPQCPSCDSRKLTRLLSLIARPAKGGEAEPAYCSAARSGEAPPCASGPCCMGGGCG